MIDKVLPIKYGQIVLITKSKENNESPVLQILKPTSLGLYSTSSAWPLSLDKEIHGSSSAKLISAEVATDQESVLLATNDETSRIFKLTRLAVMDNIVQMTHQVQV